MKWLFFAVSLAGLAFSARAEQSFRVGAAAVDITPAPGTPMAGYYAFRAVAGVTDPIFSKAIVVEQEGSYAAIVVLDLATTSRPIVNAARELISAQSGIPADRVLISATHTHTGPQLPRGSLMDDITKVNNPEGTSYLGKLPGLIAQSVAEAKAKLTPVRAGAAIGRAERLAFNRRVLREGSSQAIWQPAKIDPTKEKPAGPVDPDVGVLVFDGDKAPVASLVNFAMHPTSVGGGMRISADYPGALCKLMRERHGREMIAVFANGCCGDINQTNYLDGRRPNTQEIATRLADAVAVVWDQRATQATFAPRVRSERVTLERRQFNEPAVSKAKDVAARMMSEKLGTVAMAEAVCILENESKKDVPLEAEVQTIAIGPEIAIVALPGEIFVELGLSIKAASPFRYTHIAELSNGSIGYVPTRGAYPQGNYEVVSARGAAGSGEKLAETALRQLRELKAGP